MPPVIKKRESVWLITVIVALICIILLFFTPPIIYLNFYALFKPQAITVDNQSVTWTQLKESLELAEMDKKLKTRKEKLDTAINQAVEIAILRQTTSFSVNPNQPIYNQLQQMRQQINQNEINWRTGGYFIVQFTSRESTKSTQILKAEAKKEVDKLHQKLKSGDDFQTLLKEAENNQTIRQLNFGSFLPGRYLRKATRKDFPLKIRTFEDQFFSLSKSQVSNVIDLAWEGDKPLNERLFAYAVIKIEDVNNKSYQDYQEWLKDQKRNIYIKSFILMPFFFKWF